MISQKTAVNDFLVKFRMLHFLLCLKKVMGEPGIAISVRVRFGRLFCHTFGTACFPFS